MNTNLEIAIRASIEAGEKIMNVYNSEFEVEIKQDNSPLTEADKSGNDTINSYLIPTGIPIISEENKQSNYSERKKWKLCWIVDPLDGTKEFVKRNGEFTVNIALVANGKPILGIIYVPVTKELYFGDVLLGKSYKTIIEDELFDFNKILEKSKELKKITKNKKTIHVVGSRSHMNKETQNFIQELKNKNQKEVEIVSKGSSLKFCSIAEGLADVYPRFAPTMEWDTAAGHAICNAVGIKVMALDTKKELRYNKENLLNPWFICG